MQRYGVDACSPDDNFDFDQIASFRRFLLFARDTIPLAPPDGASTSTGRPCRAISPPSS